MLLLSLDICKPVFRIADLFSVGTPLIAVVGNIYQFSFFSNKVSIADLRSCNYLYVDYITIYFILQIKTTQFKFPPPSEKFDFIGFRIFLLETINDQ